MPSPPPRLPRTLSTPSLSATTRAPHAPPGQGHGGMIVPHADFESAELWLPVGQVIQITLAMLVALAAAALG